MKIITNKKGATFVTVLAIIMASCILVIGFSTISFWSFSSANKIVENDKTDALLASLVDSMAQDITSKNAESWVKELDAINIGDDFKNIVKGNFEIQSDRGEIQLKYTDSSKKYINLTAILHSRKKGVTLKKNYKSQAQEDMEKIYDNTFCFTSGSYWNQNISVQGNIFISGSGGMNLGTRDNPHIGDVLSSGNLELNRGSTINGNVYVQGVLKLNDNVLINGNVETGGIIEIGNTCKINGDVLCQSGIRSYGGIITGNVTSKDFDFASNKQQVGGILSYTSRLKLNGASLSENQAVEYVGKGIRKIANLPSLNLPKPIIRNDWQAPQLTNTIMPTGNYINSSGILDVNRATISKNSPLVIDTQECDLHIILKGDFNFSQDIILQGKNRAFIYVQNAINLSGHVGKMQDFDGADHPSQCRIFFIGASGYPTFRLDNGGRLDGYVYFKTGEFTAVGRGIYSKNREYKIVGSICSNMTDIEPSVTGKVVFAQPDLNDIMFDGSQSSQDSTIVTWEIERYE